MGESPFCQDYSSARALFRKAAAAAGAQVDSYAHPLPGPQGEALSTEVAWLGPPDARRVFVSVSGTHGIEGFCGSAAQVDWLVRGEAARLPAGTAAMLVHAINPFGFAWLRRVTHENVDLNRNWVDFSLPLPGNPGYQELADALCPREWHDAARASTLASLQGYIARHGLPAFVHAVSAGQHEHPQGLFFGGTAPTVARRTLEAILTRHLARAEHVGIIDYHSGLGPTGYGELMTGARTDGATLQRVRSWFGAAVVPVGMPGSASAAVAGDWMSAAAALLPHATVTAVALEFGTVDPLQVLEALRADNWLHTHGDPLEGWPGEIKQQILRAFRIDSDVWRGMILGQALAASRQAVAGLQL